MLGGSYAKTRSCSEKWRESLPGDSRLLTDYTSVVFQRLRVGKRAEKNSPRNIVQKNEKNFQRFKMLGEAGKQREIPEYCQYSEIKFF